MGRHGEARGGLCRHMPRGKANAGMPRGGLWRHGSAYAATQRDMQTNDLNDQLKTAMQLQAVLMYLCLSSAIPTLKKITCPRQKDICVRMGVWVCASKSMHTSMRMASKLRLMKVAVSFSALVCA